jgi:hypothetical protein
MNIAELKQRLVDEGCSTSNYSIGYRDSDVFCLMNEDGVWCVFYTERGQDQEPIFESASEEEACEFFFKYQTERIQHQHLVGFFHSEEKAVTLSTTLEQNGIQSRRDKIPYGGWIDPRFRVFVIGKDVFRAREILREELPIKDHEKNHSPK